MIDKHLGKYLFDPGFKWPQNSVSKSEDRRILLWLYHRLTKEHGENPDYDYMIKFNNIIGSMEG